MTQSSASTLTVLSVCSPPLPLYLLYAPSRGYADQCPLNLSSASVCAKIIGDSPPAASGANIRSLLQGGGVFCCLHHSCRKTCEERPTVGFCKKSKQESAACVCVGVICATSAICANLYAHDIPTSVVQPLLVWLPRQSACMTKELPGGCDGKRKKIEATSLHLGIFSRQA